MELVVFVLCAVILVVGAVGVIALPNPVHAALSLVATLFGVAVLFIAQEAHFLAAVQVIVYAGAIVVLFLFVLMLLGVDKAEDVTEDPLPGQRPLAVIVAAAVLGLTVVALTAGTITGARSQRGSLDEGAGNVNQIGRQLFTDYVFAFEVTAILLTIAVVAAVVLARRLRTDPPSSTDVGTPVAETEETVS